VKVGALLAMTQGMLALALLLAAAYVVGLVVFKVAGAAIHLILIGAVIALVVHFARGLSRRGRTHLPTTRRDDLLS
jgi:hypothetical protein